MRKINFIGKLAEEGKIKLTDRSKEVSLSYLMKSGNSLKAAKILYSQNLYEESISMAYHSMYHASLALLFLAGIKCENHNATIVILKELFGINNSDISFAKEERINKQYYTDFKITKEDSSDLIKKAESFCAKMEAFIDTLTNDEIKKFQDTFKGAYF